MAGFTHNQLVGLWTRAGGSGALADTMAAIAQAESSGCQFAKAGPVDDRPVKTCTYRYTTQEDSYGLWQINRDAHPSYSPTALYDPVGNAQAAVAIAGGGGNLGAWSVYRSGAYRQYLTGGTQPQTAPRPSVAPKHATPRVQFAPSRDVTVPQQPRARDVTDAWSHLSQALGYTWPQQSVAVRRMVARLPGVLRSGR